MKRGSGFLFAILLGSLLAHLSFSSASEWYECVADSDCSTSNGYPPYWFCNSNICTNACARNSDCRTGGFCGVAGSCIAKIGDTISCNGVTYLHTAAEEDSSCINGFCDNDARGDIDDYKCYSPISTYLDSNDNNCEFDINQGSFDYRCDELKNGVDCSIKNGRGYWCNLICNRENRDVSSAACLASGINCSYVPGLFNWIRAGETKAYVADQWEYTDTSTAKCCGDDTLEINRSRSSSCISNCDANDYPSTAFSNDKTDKACCDSLTDCVKAATCYSSSTSSSYAISGERVVCDTKKFYDCDTLNTYCTNACGKKWVFSGESNVGEYDSQTKLECCGDDSNEDYVDSSSFQGHSSGDKKCCNERDCVLGGNCQKSSETGGLESPYKCYNRIDDDCDSATDFCDGRYKIGCFSYDGLDPDCAATITINVKDTLNINVENAAIKVMTMFRYHEYYNVTTFYATTDANGNANLVVYGNSSYDLVIEKKGYYMSSNETKFLNLGDSWNVNAVMTRDVECNPDCTKLANNLCQADCEGSNGCHFYNTQTATLCNNKAKYIIMPYDSSNDVECCEGIPKAKQTSNAPKVEVSGANLVYRLTKPVWYRGKLVQMIIAVADQAIE